MLPESFNFAWPLAFLTIPLPLLAYWLLPRQRSNQDRALLVPDTGRFDAVVAEGQLHGRNLLRILLLIVMWLALVTATARPQYFDEPLGIPITGRDLMLCIDISGSMREEDLYAGNARVTRMAVVKQVARDFVARRTGDRIGLIMFGSNAYVQSPLTHDHETVQHFLDEAVVGLAGRSTAIGDAIGLGVKRLRDRESDARVLILLTDGENSEGAVDPLDAARLAADSNIKVHTIGVGSESSGGLFGRALGFQRSELDERTLKEIASITGGEYFRARDQKELENIYKEIDRIEPTDLDEKDFRPLRELFVWPLALALAFNLLWALTIINRKPVSRG